ncbi:MAG: branched-chain amino acid transport system II carrier protein [Clostridiales bacterium]|nr:branched-chain amino acid transport system II carrier protein [Clostridiales bacterium]
MHRRRDPLIAGFALFAMFLGAGNIIFPPYTGVHAGSSWLAAALGFVLTGAGLPILGAVAVAKVGGDSNELSRRFSITFGKVLNLLILIMIGPLFAIPRTAATTTEMSVLPFLPEGTSLPIAFAITSAVFFLLSFLLSISEGKVLDTMGGFLTPVMIVALTLLAILSFINPIGTPVQSTLTEAPFYYGFTSGYQTMDGIGSLVISASIAMLLAKKGYEGKEKHRILLIAALIAGTLLGLVYFAYTWIGASGSSFLQGITDRTVMLTTAVNRLAGVFGQAILGVIIFFACLTTASGLTVTFAQYVNKLSKGKLPYRMLVLGVTLFSFAVSLIGVEGIISLAAPVLEVIYPICIVLILLNLFDRFVKSDAFYRGAMLGTIAFSLILLLKYIPGLKDYANHIIKVIPLGGNGFGYITTALLGAAIGYVVSLLMPQHKQKKGLDSAQ